MLSMIIVEDERLERERLVDFLDWNNLGLQLAGTACDGIEGIELAQRVKPDIIITDIKMPGIPGTEMIKTISEFLPDVRVIVLTGYDDYKFIEEAVGFNVTACLLKPVEERELLETVKMIVDGLEAD